MANVEIKDTMLNGLRQHIIDMTVKGQYKVGSTWRDAEISSKEIGTNSNVYINMIITPASSAAETATEFRLLNNSNQVLASRQENVSFIAGIDSIMYRFIFGVTVAEGE